MKATERNRMILDLPAEVQLAVRLRAVKDRTTTGRVVCEAVERTFPDDVKEARAALAERTKTG